MSSSRRIRGPRLGAHSVGEREDVVEGDGSGHREIIAGRVGPSKLEPDGVDRYSLAVGSEYPQPVVLCRIP
jgi:hypothetical protein